MRYRFVLALFLGFIIAGCGAPKQGQGGMDADAGNDGGVDIIIDASGEENDSIQPLDISNDSGQKDSSGGSARWKKPAGYQQMDHLCPFMMMVLLAREDMNLKGKRPVTISSVQRSILRLIRITQ